MNNKECSVMRDLMPLCIDGAASEASRELVVKHVWECEECAKAYADMQGHLLAAPDEDQDYLDEAARRLRRRSRNRKRLLIALTAVLTAVLLIAGFCIWDYAVNLSQIPLGADEFSAVLNRTQDGRVIMDIHAADSYLSYGFSGAGQMHADGSYTITITPHTTLVRKYFDNPRPPQRALDFMNVCWQDGQAWVRPSERWEEFAPLQVTSIHIVSAAGERVIYQAGDDIPLCSPEMDAYYQAMAEFEQIDEEATLRLDELNDKMAELAKLVPEWNTAE